MVSQFSHLLGVTAPTEIHGEFSIMRKLWYYGNEMVDANGATAVIAISAMLIIYACKKITAGRIVFGRGRCGISIASADEAQRLRFPIPAELIVVIIFNSLTYMASLDTNYGVKVVGEYVPFRSLPARPTCTPRPAKSHSKRDSKSTRTHVHTRTPTHAHARPRLLGPCYVQTSTLLHQLTCPLGQPPYLLFQARRQHLRVWEPELGTDAPVNLGAVHGDHHDRHHHFFAHAVGR
jgi:hypothetical protein